MAGFLFKSPSYQLVDANGDVYPGAKLNFYLTGTSTRSNSYQEAALSTPHTNPVVADSAGLFAPIFLDPTKTYKVVVTDSADEVLQTIDPVVIDIGAGNTPFSGLTPAANKGVYYTSGTAAALFDLTAYGRSLVAVANETGLKALTNSTIGEDVQAWDDDLDDLAALSHAAGKIIYSDGTDWQTLDAGTAGYKLQANGAGAPSWVVGSDDSVINLAISGSKTIGASSGAKSLVKSVALTGTSGDLVVIRINTFTCADPNTGNTNIFANLWVEKDSAGSALDDAEGDTTQKNGSAGGAQAVSLNNTIIFDAVTDSSEHTYNFKVWSNNTTGNTSAIVLAAEVYLLSQNTLVTTFDF